MKATCKKCKKGIDVMLIGIVHEEYKSRILLQKGMSVTTRDIEILVAT